MKNQAKRIKQLSLIFIMAVLTLAMCNCKKNDPIIEDWAGVWELESITMIIELDSQNEPIVTSYKTSTTSWNEYSSYDPDGTLNCVFDRNTDFGLREHKYTFELLNNTTIEGDRTSYLDGEITSTTYNLKFKKQ